MQERVQGTSRVAGADSWKEWRREPAGSGGAGRPARSGVLHRAIAFCNTDASQSACRRRPPETEGRLHGRAPGRGCACRISEGGTSEGIADAGSACNDDVYSKVALVAAQAAPSRREHPRAGDRISRQKQRPAPCEGRAALLRTEGKPRTELRRIRRWERIGTLPPILRHPSSIDGPRGRASRIGRRPPSRPATPAGRRRSEAVIDPHDRRSAGVSGRRGPRRPREACTSSSCTSRATRPWPGRRRRCWPSSRSPRAPARGSGRRKAPPPPGGR